MKRKQLSKRDIRELTARIQQTFGDAAVATLPKDVIALQDSDLCVYASTGGSAKSLFFERDSSIYPTITTAATILPKVAIDLGAIKFVLKGADLMRPGVTGIKEEFHENSPVAIIAGEGLCVAVGIALQSSDIMRGSSSGKCVQIIHRGADVIDKALESPQ
ncbi:hypothetical protein AUJ68_01765 [Candidatus Woesearchaeota archaeon CG1_02_57_44]|nr:MAG: hypothetical protein AUJ68_01765 [Candidatus Woesearchaeota archaeon CG1_02_57_44]PIN68365.1 MAG: hypothetical protein COV94_05035 [Candidatus Woesearchaeota archaeon CG11_big_fil_rev_8_21_14_0_20_57_5]